MGPGNEGSDLKVSRAYIAGLGTTGVLIGSFVLLLTVGSALVAFRGVPGVATNGDLSSIELLQQSEQANGGGGKLIAAGDAFGEGAGRAEDGFVGGVLGARAAGNSAAGRFFGSASDDQSDRLHANSPRAPLGQRAPGGSPGSSTPGTLVAAPPSSGSGTGSGSGSGSGSGTGSGSDSGSGSGSAGGSDTGSGSGSGTDSGSDTAGSGSGSAGSGSSGSDAGSGTDTGTGTGTGTDTGSGSSGSGSSGSGSGGSASEGEGSGSTGGTVTDPVEDVTETVGSVVGVANPGAGEATGGLVDDVTSAVGGLGG